MSYWPPDYAKKLTERFEKNREWTTEHTRGRILEKFRLVLNTRAWQTKESFTEELKYLNKKMSKENRKVVLLLDNASAHLVDRTFSNVRIVYLLKNSTSFLQPCDQYWNAALKSNFKSWLNVRVAHLRNAIQIYQYSI